MNKPPRCKRPDESTEDYRIAMGWDRPLPWNDRIGRAIAGLPIKPNDPTDRCRAPLLGACEWPACSDSDGRCSHREGGPQIEEIRANLKEAIARGRDPYLTAEQCATLVQLIDSYRAAPAACVHVTDGEVELEQLGPLSDGQLLYAKPVSGVGGTDGR